MIRQTLTALALAATLAACGPNTGTAPAPDSARDNAAAAPAAAAPAKPAKPPLPPTPLPPNVTREVLPDGTIRITIREPRCPNCTPWTF